MPGNSSFDLSTQCALETFFEPLAQCVLETFFDPEMDDDSSSSAYMKLMLLTGIATALVAFAGYAKSKNRFNYDSVAAQIIAGTLFILVNTFHTTKGDIEEIEDTKGAIVASVPHYMGLPEAVALASKLKGTTPPSFLATTVYNGIPGAAAFLRTLKTIPVPPKPEKGAVVASAKRVIEEGGLVVLFPPGNFSKIGQEPPPVYDGAAQLAIQTKKPIHVVRPSGYWSLNNPLLPLWVRNNSYFRAALSMFCHMHNIRFTYCCKIDLHLKAENAHLSEEELVHRINAQLYAYSRDTRELSPEEIKKITTRISKSDHHLRIWSNKSEQVKREREITALRKAAAELDKEQIERESVELKGAADQVATTSMRM